jgi:hypothetical protein
MNKRWYLFMSAFSILMLIFALNAPCSAGPDLYCARVHGSAPGIDGVYNLSQWPTTPQIILNTPAYPIQTNFYCMYNSDNLYILVDALGDTTDDNNRQPTHDACSSSNIQNCDECLLVFSDTGGTTISQAEVWGKAGDIIGSHVPVNTQVSIGFNGHRFYEWMIPLISINASPGQVINFSSPKLCKGVSNGGSYCASMPYDGFDSRDNEWPSGVLYHDLSTWASLQLGVAIPTLTEWGMIIFIILAGLGAVYYLKRRKRAES